MCFFKRKENKRKEKRMPWKVTVCFDNHGQSTNEFNARHTFERVIIVPPGYEFKCEFARRPRLVGRSGEIIQAFDWKGGYEVVYEFSYEQEAS